MKQSDAWVASFSATLLLQTSYLISGFANNFEILWLFSDEGYMYIRVSDWYLGYPEYYLG